MNLKSYASNLIIDSKNRSLEAGHERSFSEWVLEKIAQSPDQHQKRLHSEFFNYGPLDAILENKSISEIIFDGSQIIIEKNGILETIDDNFLTDFTFSEILHKIYQESGIVTDFKKPFADGRWNQFRIHVIQYPISTQKTVVTLRRNSDEIWNIDQLVAASFLSSDESQWLQQQVREGENLLIVGETGSGKTTLINSLLRLVPKNQRVIVIEDTDELVKASAYTSKLIARPATSESLPEVTLNDLIKQSLRMRPDRIILGEVRGEEAKDLLLALSTGHRGFIGSLHAKSGREALWRLEMLIQMGAPQWNLRTVRQLIYTSLNYIVVVSRDNGKRRIIELVRLAGLEDHGFLLEEIKFKTGTSN